MKTWNSIQFYTISFDYHIKSFNNILQSRNQYAR